MGGRETIIPKIQQPRMAQLLFTLQGLHAAYKPGLELFGFVLLMPFGIGPPT